MKVTDQRTGKVIEVPERFGKILVRLPRYSTRHLVAAEETSATASIPPAPRKRGRPPKVRPEPSPSGDIRAQPSTTEPDTSI